MPLPISAAPVPFTVESRASRRFAAERWAGRRYPADCARAHGKNLRAINTLYTLSTAAGGSVKVVSLIRFNCLHYYFEGNALLTEHYDFKEVQININEPRAGKMRTAINIMNFISVRDILITPVNYETVHDV